MNLKGVEWEGVEWIRLAENMDKGLAEELLAYQGLWSVEIVR
jgi:hypothetical protein